MEVKSFFIRLLNACTTIVLLCLIFVSWAISTDYAEKTVINRSQSTATCTTTPYSSYSFSAYDIAYEGAIYPYTLDTLERSKINTQCASEVQKSIMAAGYSIDVANQQIALRNTQGDWFTTNIYTNTQGGLVKQGIALLASFLIGSIVVGIIYSLLHYIIAGRTTMVEA